MISKKKALATGLLCAIASVGFVADVQAEEMMTSSIDEFIIEGNKDELPGGLVNGTPNVGLFGGQDVMDVPFSVTSVTHKAIQAFASPHNGISDALTLDPAVRNDRGGTYTDISIRGIYQDGHRFYVNGVPGLLAQENLPFYWVDTVSVVAGPNLGINGSSLSEAVSGTVNFKSKIASEEGNSSVKIGYRGGQSMEEGLDIGRRFGKDNRFGIRIAANNVGGDGVIDGENFEQQNFSVNLDQRSEKSMSNLLIAYDHTKHSGALGCFNVDDAVTVLPDAPDASKSYKPDWAYNEYDNWRIAFNHEQEINDNLNAFINAGYHREDWYGYVDGFPKLTDNDGNFALNMTNYPLASTKEYVGIGLKGEFNMGSVENKYIIGFDKSWQDYALSKNNNFGNAAGNTSDDNKGNWKGTGNIYQNNWWNNDLMNNAYESYKPTHNSKTRMTGWHIIDTMKALDDKLTITLGLHGHEVKKTPKAGGVQKSDAISPTYAVSYKINPDTMVYASHSESFGAGSMVDTNKGYENAGEILDPTKTKQNEIGIKVKTGNFMNTFAAFQIEKANNVDFKDSEGKKWLRQDGEQRNRGFEWGFTGNLNDRWDLIGGAMYLDAEQHKTAGGINDGKRVTGAAKWSSTVGAIYHPDEDWSVIGKLTYLDSTTIKNNLHVPSYVRMDLGASYDTFINNTPVTFHAMCYNVFGKDYWQARSGMDSLGLGAPRTFVLSAEFDI